MRENNTTVSDRHDKFSPYAAARSSIRRAFRMSGNEETFHYTKEDVAKLESRVARNNDGKIPAGSEAAALQVR